MSASEHNNTAEHCPHTNMAHQKPNTPEFCPTLLIWCSFLLVRPPSRPPPAADLDPIELELPTFYTARNVNVSTGRPIEPVQHAAMRRGVLTSAQLQQDAHATVHAAQGGTILT